MSREYDEKYTAKQCRWCRKEEFYEMPVELCKECEVDVYV